MSKRIISLIIVLACLMGMCACGADRNKGDDSAESPRETSSLSDWTIVYPRSSVSAKTCAENLRDLIASKSGVTLTVRSDYSGDSGEREILVGATDRALSTEAAAKITDTEYRIEKSGDKIALVAKYDSVLSRATAYFTETYISGISLNIPVTLSYIGESEGFLRIAENKKSDYTIVYPVNADGKTKETVNGLTTYVISLSTAFITTCTDDDKTNECEILIGRVDRPESEAVYKDLGYNQYRISVSGKKIIIAAWNAAALNTAVTVFKSALKNAAVDGSLLLDSTVIVSEGTPSALTVDIPVFDGGRLANIYDCGDNTSEMYYSGTSAEIFDGYCSKLAQNGYVKYSDNSFNSNKYAVYNNSTKNRSIFVGYTAASGVTRVIASPLGTMLPTSPENTTAVTTNEFAMIALGDLGNGENNGVEARGASFVIRLADGRFVVIDGGTNVSSEISKLYNYMNNAKPEGTDKIVIAAWILTHPHSDHYGLMQGFANTYAHSVKLEKIIYNIYSSATEDPSMKDTEKREGERIHDSVVPQIAQNLDCKTLIKVHTGQKFYIGNVQFEMLFTHEDLYPVLVDHGNDASLVFKMTIGGKVFLMVGDIEAAATKQLMAQCGNYLECEYMQIVHHGWDSDGRSNDTAKNSVQYDKLYKTVKATYALWTVQLDVSYYNMISACNNYKSAKKYIPNIISTADGNFILDF